MLRRPGWSDWALNTAADADPDLVRAFADAADVMRAAQQDALAGRGDGVAAALREVRARTTELARCADAHLRTAGRGSELPGLVERLTAIAASGTATVRLRGALLRDGDETLDEPPDGPDVTAPARRRSKRAAPATPAPDDRLQADHAADHAADLAATRRDLVRSVAERERAQRTADHHVARAEHTLAEALTKRELAAAAVNRAQAELDRAAERADAAAATVDALRAAAGEETAALAQLRAELDALGR